METGSPKPEKVRLNRNGELTADLNDRVIRLVFTPLFGVVIPVISGIVTYSLYSWYELIPAYACFIFIAWMIWEGNLFLFKRLHNRLSWIIAPYQKVLQLLVAYLLYTVTISVAMLGLWYLFSREPYFDWAAIARATGIISLAVIFITHIYETAALIREWAKDRINHEKTERAKAEAELQALKNQLDPHFIFNSLNTLSYLLEMDAGKARRFTDHLAEAYRYILQRKDRNLVLLREEMEFLHNYFALLSIRFGNALELKMEISDTMADGFLVPPISLQVLVENAIKHNEFSDAEPLIIKVSCAEGYITVSNRLRRKILRKESSRIGLRNLNERYKLITERTISCQEDETHFKVTLPALKIAG